MSEEVEIKKDEFPEIGVSTWEIIFAICGYRPKKNPPPSQKEDEQTT